MSADSLLYIPDDDLVRSTVEGDDANWSDARNYVPADTLISSVLRASGRETPRFKFPDWYAPARTDGDPVRIASAMFASLHLSPMAFAAATVLHVVAIVVLGPLTLVDRNGEPPRRVASPAVPSPQLIYYVARPAESAPRIRRMPVRVTVSRPGLELTNRDSTRRPSPPVTESVAAGADSGARVERGPENRELAAALDQEFRLGGDPQRVEAPDRERLLVLVRVLEARPQVRLRVVGTGPPGPDRRVGAQSGMREAEALARELIALGVERARIDLEASGEQGCPEREPRCGANRSRAKTSIAPSAAEPRRP